MSEKKTSHLGIKLSPQTKKALARKATDDGRTLSDYCRRVLEQHVGEK